MRTWLSGLEERVRGSHHVFRKAGVGEKLNLQESGGHPESITPALSERFFDPFLVDVGTRMMQRTAT
ncbi:MAG: hypothetical protein ACYC6T_12950 [Thermoleophilia bacterium]